MAKHRADWVAPDTKKRLKKAMLIWDDFQIVWGPHQTPTDREIPSAYKVSATFVKRFRKKAGWGVIYEK
jgi:hypothetical protein